MEEIARALRLLVPPSHSSGHARFRLFPPARRLLPAGEKPLARIVSLLRRFAALISIARPFLHAWPRRAKFGHRGSRCHRRFRHGRQLPPRGPLPPTQRAPRLRRERRIAVALPYSSVLTSMPCSHKVWQLRQWAFPLMATLHSKQIPIPHSGPRGSPLTEVRHAFPASRTAVVTVAPEGTVTGTPFTVTTISLSMDFHHGRA